MTRRPWWAPWAGRQGLAALVLLTIAAVWRGILLHGSFFNQDDFYLSGRAYRSDLDVSFLLRDTAGHVNPLQQLTYWLVSHHAPYDWAVVASFVLALQVGTAVVLWLVLSRLLPGRWVRLPLLAVLTVSPLTLATTLWWSAAMGLWPHLLCSLLAVWFLLRRLQGDGVRWLNVAGIVLSFLVGLAWHERAVLIPPLLFAVAVAYPLGVTGPRRLWVALRDSWAVWLLLTVLSGGFLVVHSLLTDVVGASTSPQTMAAVGGRFVFQSVIPGLAGGPWQATLQGGAVRPATWTVVLAVALAVLAVLALLRWGGEARRWALALLLLYVLADLALLISGRSGFGSVIALDPRYSSDVVQALPVAAALALRGQSRRRPPRLLVRRGAFVGLALTAVYVAAAGVGTAPLVPHFQNTQDRAYITQIRSELARDPTQVMVDELAPAGVVLPLVGDDSLLSRILAPLPEHPAFNEPSMNLREVTDHGELVPVDVPAGITARPGPDPVCGYPVRAGRTAVDFPVELQGPVLLRLAYFTDDETTVSVRVGEWQTRFLAGRGLGVMWVPVPDTGRPFTEVELRDDGRSTVCLTSAGAGRAEPK